MFIYFDHEEQPVRELGVISRNIDLRGMMARHLYDTHELSLEEKDLEGFPDVALFLQENTKASRKVVLPLVKDFLDSR